MRLYVVLAVLMVVLAAVFCANADEKVQREKRDSQKRTRFQGSYRKQSVTGNRRIRNHALKRNRWQRKPQITRVIYRGRAGGLASLGLPKTAGRNRAAQTRLRIIKLSNHAKLNNIYGRGWTVHKKASRRHTKFRINKSIIFKGLLRKRTHHGKKLKSTFGFGLKGVGSVGIKAQIAVTTGYFNGDYSFYHLKW